MVEKDFKVDPNIFKDQYDILIEKVKMEEIKKQEMENLEKQKLDLEEKKRKETENLKKDEERSDIYNRYRGKQV